MLFVLASIAVLAIPLIGYRELSIVETVSEPEYAEFIDGAIVAVGFAILVWVSVLMLVSAQDDELKLTFPRYLTRLPVSAWKLVAARMSFGMVSSFVLALGGTSLTYALFDPEMDHDLPFYTQLVACPVAYAVLQAVVWWVGPAGFVKTVAVIFGVPSILGFVFAFFRLDTYIPFESFDWEQYEGIGVSAGASIVITLSFLAGAAAITQHRKGRFLGLEIIPSSWRRNASSTTDLSETFASKVEALRWFHYQRQAGLLPKILLVMFIGILLFSLFGFYLDEWRLKNPPPSLNAFQVYFASSVMGAVIGALALAILLVASIFLLRGWGPLFKKDGVFLFVRPATTMELITARWESSAKAVVLGGLPLFAIFVAALFLDVHTLPNGVDERSSFGHLASQHPVYLILLMGAAAIVYLCVTLWASLWIENAVGMCIIAACVIIPMESYAALVENEPDNFEAYEFRLAGIAVFAALAFFFFATWRNRLLSVKHLLILLGLAPIVGIGYLAIANLQWVLMSIPVDERYLTTLLTVLPAIMMVVIAPIITGPAIMQWARHRR